MAFVTGDIHGDELGNDFSERMERLRLVATEPNIDLGNPRIDDASPYAPICVTVGDVKLKYGNASSPKLRKYMNSHRDITFVIMRGNHDTRYCRDHVTQYRMPVHGWKRTERDRFGSSFLYEERHPNVLYVSDGGGMYDVCGEPTLFIPGAYSPDQEFRMVHGEPYEIAEQLTTLERRDLYDIACDKSIGRLTVVSHTCPLSWQDEFSGLLNRNLDQSKIDQTMETWLDAIWDTIQDRCDAWFFGHFHHDLSIQNTHDCGRMMFHDIAMMPSPYLMTATENTKGDTTHEIHHW